MRKVEKNMVAANSRNILITGASSGIGEAVLKELALKSSAETPINIIITARRLPILEALKQEIEIKYPSTKIIPLELDITNYRQVHNYFSSTEYDISLVVASAGITEPLPVPIGFPSYPHLIDNQLREDNGMMQFLENKRVIDTNLLGTMAITSAALNHFRKRKVKGGHFVGISSIAADRAFAGLASYCTSKIGITRFLETVRVETRKEGFIITTIHPGYIDTPLNNMMKSRPFVVTAEKGAKEICDIIEKKTNGNVSVPWWPWFWLRSVLKILPERLLGTGKYEYSKL